MLAGNVVALLTPLITVPLLSFAFSSGKYDWMSMMAIKRGDDSDLASAAHMELESVPGEIETDEEMATDQIKLAKAAKIAGWSTVFLTLAMLVLWPMPMLGSNYIFSKPFFTGWVTVVFIWLFCSAFCVVIYPLFEGRGTIAKTCKAIYLDVTGKKKPRTYHGEPALAGHHDAAASDDEKVDKKGVDTPPEKAVEG